MNERIEAINQKFNNYFNESNFKTLSILNWENIFSKELSFKFTTRPYGINPIYLYRARINYDCEGNSIIFFKEHTDLWAPPEKAIIKQGRCNIKGQSMLYCSTCPTTTIFEISPETGSEITIIEYVTIENIYPLMVIGVNDIIKAGADYNNIFGNHFQNTEDEARLLDKILSNIFKSKIENTYNLTNAITQIFLNEQKDNFLQQNMKPPPAIGLIYPSVETVAVLGMNIVMNPQEVKKLLKPNIAYKYKIIQKHTEHHYEILLTHQTKPIDINKELIWEPKQNRIENITDINVSLNNNLL